MNEPDYKKITQVLNYIARKEGGKINYMKALKLVYLADRLHLRKYGRLITDDRLIAMKYGTLGSQARDIVMLNGAELSHTVYEYSKDKLKRDLDKHVIESNFKSVDSLSETDIECLDQVVSVLGNKDEFYLAKLTHELPEFKRHEYTINKGEKLLANLTVSDLFDSTSDKELNKIFSQSESELVISKEIFNELSEEKIPS